jgi:sugar lactone lactonase YvrE
LVPAGDSKSATFTGHLTGSAKIHAAKAGLSSTDSGVLTVIPLIHTVAGNGTSGFSGDGGPATSAQLYYPRDVAFDASGNFYIADGSNQRVRKVNSSGTITTVAGNGTAGYSGDGGPATSASLRYPEGLVVDASGNLYIADSNNHRVRRVNLSTGYIYLVAGNGSAAYGGDGGLATAASLNLPAGLALDAAGGNLYIADSSNQRIRRVNLSTGYIYLVAGNGSAVYGGDGGPATNASLNYPGGVGLDTSGNLFIADSRNHRIRKVDTSGTITTVAGNGTPGYGGDGGPAISAQLNGPGRVAVYSAGSFLIADVDNRRIRKVDVATGIITTVAGTGQCCSSGDGGAAINAKLSTPWSVVLDQFGNFYITEIDGWRIRKVDH